MRTYPVYMNVTLSLDDRLIDKARRKAAAAGTSLNQVVREQIRQYVGEDDPASIIEEFLKLGGDGDSQGWRFNREEMHERR